jgi:hypothetical protein
MIKGIQLDRIFFDHHGDESGQVFVFWLATGFSFH